MQDASRLFQSEVVVELGRNAETAGYFPTTTIVFPGEPPAESHWISAQVRVWSPELSRWSYDAQGPHWAGASPIFRVWPDQVTTEFRSFSLGWLDPEKIVPMVPEPGAGALLLAGLLARTFCSSASYVAKNRTTR